MEFMKDTFSDWLNEQLNELGWSYREFGRRLDVSHTYAINIANGTSSPDSQTLLRIAQVFGVPAHVVLKKAGILPDTDDPFDDANVREIYDLLKVLPQRDRYEILEYTRLRYRLFREEQDRLRDEQKKTQVVGIGLREWKDTD